MGGVGELLFPQLNQCNRCMITKTLGCPKSQEKCKTEAAGGGRYGETSRHANAAIPGKEGVFCALALIRGTYDTYDSR